MTTINKKAEQKARFFHVLFIFLIGGIGANTLVSCSSDDDCDCETPSSSTTTAETQSSSSVGTPTNSSSSADECEPNEFWDLPAHCTAGSSSSTTTQSSNSEEELCGEDPIPDTHFCVADVLYEKCGGQEYENPTAFKRCHQDRVPVWVFEDSRDTKEYEYVKINGKYWMAENLNYVNDDWAFNNSDAWGGDMPWGSKGSWCHPAEETNCGYTAPATLANCDIYGRLYSWDAAMEACPTGWHLPELAEWAAMVNFVGGNSSGNTWNDKNATAGIKLKAVSGWAEHESGNHVGTDDYGFAALPGGYRGGGSCMHGVPRTEGNWATATLDGSTSAYSVGLETYDDYFTDYNQYRGDGFSVRCVKN